MFTLYYVVSPSTDGLYVGITKDARKRFYQHNSDSKRNDTRLYRAMRKYKDFCLVPIEVFEHREDCCEAEVQHIAFFLSKGCKVYNHTSGGEVGFSREGVDIDSWIRKLRLARKGRKPALGMRHTEENKVLFGELSKLRWDLYGRYPDEVTQVPFKEAKALYGISKTHYYRLKRAKANDLS
jgi:predicted GIY-YIG superfamily endonuclease